MLGRKKYTEKPFLNFRLSDRIPEDNLYRRLRETLDLGFLYRDTKELYGKTGNPSIDPVVFFKLLI
jgi:transposase